MSLRLLGVLLLQNPGQGKPLIDRTTTQLDDVVLDALIAALRREQEGSVNGRTGNGGAL